jgi:Holliday junction resolvase RusA-like endonuclease
MLEGQIKALEYRRLDGWSCLRCRFSGPLLTKKGMRARHNVNQLRETLTKDVGICRWKYAPRAKIAVAFSFYDLEKNNPEVHSLVKFYMDLLKAVVFKDDRQVYYLEASTLRVKPEQGQSSVFIEIRRLVDYERYVELATEAQRELADEIDEDEDWDRFPWLVDVRDPQDWHVAEVQYRLLSETSILSHSRARRKFGFRSSMDEAKNVHPYVIELGPLPLTESTVTFKNRIGAILDDYVARRSLLNRIRIPIELNAQITKQAIRLSKDLDNLMLIVCPLIREKLLHPKAYINGYRVHVVDDEKLPLRLSIQLLKPGAIEEFQSRMERGFKAYGKELEN